MHRDCVGEKWANDSNVDGDAGDDDILVCVCVRAQHETQLDFFDGFKYVICNDDDVLKLMTMLMLRMTMMERRTTKTFLFAYSTLILFAQKQVFFSLLFFRLTLQGWSTS